MNHQINDDIFENNKNVYRGDLFRTIKAVSGDDDQKIDNYLDDLFGEDRGFVIGFMLNRTAMMLDYASWQMRVKNGMA